MAFTGFFRTLASQQGLHRYLLATLAGWLLPLAFAPYRYWFVVPVAVTLLLLAMKAGRSATHLERRFRPNALIGWFFGLGLFGNGASWIYISIHDYGYTGAPLALLLTLFFVMGLSLLTALQCGLYQRFLSHTSPVWSFPAIWIIFEWVRGWILTGFPWLYTGSSLVDSPLSSFLPLGGVFLAGFLSVMTGSLLFQFVRQRLKLRTLLAWVMLLFVSGHLLQKIDWVQPGEHSLEVALVQGNIDQNEKWQRQHQQRFLRLYHNLSQDVQSSQLIIWPETAVPLLYRHSHDYFDQVLADLPQDSALITGIPQQLAPGQTETARFYNSIMVTGQGSGLYRKQKLVPFGEYVPMESLLRGLIQFFNLPMSSFVPGAPDQALLKAHGLTIAPFICYEVVYPEFVRQQAQNSDLLVTISNDSWFGRSVGPLQHLQMAQVRAAENGRYLLRGTNNGVTAIISPSGKILQRGPQFEQAIVRGEVYAMIGHTPFSRFGSQPLLILCGLILLVQMFQRPKRAPLQLFK